VKVKSALDCAAKTGIKPLNFCDADLEEQLLKWRVGSQF
jgi:hypothetical protein